MIVFPNCKINLGLRILRKRSDGFHDLETLFYPIPLFDVLETVPLREEEQQQNTGFKFTSSGINVTPELQNNSCIKAFQLLNANFPGQLPPLHLHLHKNIPAGAGLGGGSADAAFTLLLLNNKFQLNLSTDQLVRYAAMLGSDCAFFIINNPCIGTGRGEILQEMPVDLSSYKFFIVNPGIHIHTGNAFAGIVPALPPVSIKEIIHSPVETWKDSLVNDFEQSVFRDHPSIKAIKDQLYEAGAVYASMSGSGSTVYALFKKEVPIHISFPTGYFYKELVS